MFIKREKIVYFGQTEHLNQLNFSVTVGFRAKSRCLIGFDKKLGITSLFTSFFNQITTLYLKNRLF